LEWEKGIKVTAVHEFYHSVQYAYTPNPWPFHYWYEASAVGMEERLADEINDYLQYLPDLFARHANYSLNGPYYDRNETYATGIFHNFLTYALGIDFDVGVWNFMADNNSPDDALKHVFTQRDATVQDLYTRFTQPLIYAQRRNDCPSSISVFNEDLAVWPRIDPRSFRLNDPFAFGLPPLTFAAYEPEETFEDVHKIISVEGASGLTITNIYDSQVSVQSMETDVTNFGLLIPPTNGKEHLLLFSNGSWDKRAEITVSPASTISDTAVFAYPNPFQMKNTLSGILFTKPPNPDSITTIKIYSEYGTPVKTLELDSAKNNWIWNLYDDSLNTVTAGIYYYLADNEPMKPLLILNGEVE
jgi:hypothetical protein